MNINRNRAKGINKNVINNDIKHYNYKKVISGDGKNSFYEN